MGAINTLLGLLLIYAGLYFFGMSDVTANLFGYSVGLLISYALHRLWTFGDRGPIRRSLPIFIVVTLAAYLCNLGAVLAAHRGLGVDVYAAQLVGVATYVVVGFVGNRCLTFSASRGKVR